MFCVGEAVEVSNDGSDFSFVGGNDLYLLASSANNYLELRSKNID